MTYNRPKPRPRLKNDDRDAPEKPYELVPFPRKSPPLKHPVGHDRYRQDRWHGKLELRLIVKTGVHVSTGIVVMGADVGDRVPLVKTMVLNPRQQLAIPGSSLKGVVRSVYEAITNSTLAVVTNKYRSKIPKPRLPCKEKEELCPASLVFGAIDWQGLVYFADATCERQQPVTGFLPSLYRPRPDERQDYFQGDRIKGRKFYYHAVQAVSGGDRGIPVRQAGTEYIFKTVVRFENLTQAELGTLLVVLGQDDRYPIALKVGAGKPIGMGTMVVDLEALVKPQSLKQRYSRYARPEDDRLTGAELKSFANEAIAAAHKSLIERPQWEALAEILAWPTEREAPEGMY